MLRLTQQGLASKLKGQSKHLVSWEFCEIGEVPFLQRFKVILTYFCCLIGGVHGHDQTSVDLLALSAVIVSCLTLPAIKAGAVGRRGLL